MKIRCLIVDDEVPATELLASYLTRIEDFEISGICNNALEAFTFLQRNPIDLVFLIYKCPACRDWNSCAACRRNLL